MNHSIFAAGALFLLAFALFPPAPRIASGAQQVFQADDFSPSKAGARFAVPVGNKVTVGGPGATNFLPNEWMDVFVVPHRTWREGDPLAPAAVKRIKIKSDAWGELPLTDLWKTDLVGQFDIIVDYDGNGRFSYGLDALDSFLVIGKMVASVPRP